MRSTYIIFKRELKLYFVSPVAYVVAFVFLFIGGYLSIGFFERSSEADVGGLLGNFLILVLFACPILTIKVFSEEKSTGTIELLFTSPLRTIQLVLGKFFASWFLFTLILACTFLFVLFMELYSEFSGPDYGVVFTGYLGLWFMSGSFIGIGIFSSALTRSQVVAAISGFGVSLFFLLVHSFIPSGSDTIASQVMKEVSLLSHYIDFDRGILDSHHVIFYIFWIMLTILLTHRALESQYWK